VIVFTPFPIMVVHDIRSFNKISLASTRHDNSYRLDNVELTNQGQKLKTLKLISVMNKTSLNCTWKTCGNKWWLGNHIITIHLHGFLLR
jgi:hypothetical protein